MARSPFKKRLREIRTNGYLSLSNIGRFRRKCKKVRRKICSEIKKVPEMLNQEIKLLKGGRMPGLLIVDKGGIIQYAYYGDSMSDIPENDTLFEVLEKI
jgi:hypothetical protein